jgi:hypothetical protein
MWRELESEYHNTAITEMENELKARKRTLYDIYMETQTEDKVRQD